MRTCALLDRTQARNSELEGKHLIIQSWLRSVLHQDDPRTKQSIRKLGLLLQRSLYQLLEVWRPKACNGIPSLLCWETGGVTADAGAAGDIVQSLVGASIEPRIEESEHRLALRKESVVNQSNDCSKRRG